MQANHYQMFTIDTAIYPEAGSGSLGALSYVTLGLAGEAGEIANKVKKLIRDGASPEKREAIGKELGDVCWYIARLADELGINLEDLFQMNADKLSDRKARGVIGGSGDGR